MKDLKEYALRELAKEIERHADWWLFPPEDPIQGFMGNGPIFIIGDQPSNSPWEAGHPCRTAFYETLLKSGLSNSHLTDVYKKRGEPNELETFIPDDFDKHLEILRLEIEIVKPKRIVALGYLAQTLLMQRVPEARHVPECRNGIPRMWHFSYVVQEGLRYRYEENMREAAFG